MYTYKIHIFLLIYVILLLNILIKQLKNVDYYFLYHLKKISPKFCLNYILCQNISRCIYKIELSIYSSKSIFSLLVRFYNDFIFNHAT